MPPAIFSRAASPSSKSKPQFDLLSGFLPLRDRGGWNAAETSPTGKLGTVTYQTKQVRPVFVENATEILVVTVYTYFFGPIFSRDKIVKISYDSEVDALHIIFQETAVTTEHLAEGIAADYDAAGQLAGIEILDARLRFGSQETLGSVVLEGVGPAVAT